ncbi:MAG TPA: hypothetical protein VFM39_01465 [bacterium]|nr:hypothetical protein [bacterium]
MEVFASRDWYRERPEPERAYSGKLHERRVPVGPGDRAGLDYVLISDTAEIPVYSAGASHLLQGFVGTMVRARGKLVDLTGEGSGKELWCATIESMPRR